MYVCMCVCKYEHMYVCICAYIHIYMYVCIYTHIHIYVYIHTYTYICRYPIRSIHICFIIFGPLYTRTTWDGKLPRFVLIFTFVSTQNTHIHRLSINTYVRTLIHRHVCVCVYMYEYWYYICLWIKMLIGYILNTYDHPCSLSLSMCLHYFMHRHIWISVTLLYRFCIWWTQNICDVIN
jgi:hypothetical protein